MAEPTYHRLEEIQKHTTETDLWFVRNGRVYNVTAFIDQHPGGMDTLMGVAGKDGTADFDAVGHSDSAKEDLERYFIGLIHPDDKDKVPTSVQTTQSNYFGMAIVFVLLAVCLFFIFKP